MNNRLIKGALPITAKLLADDLGLKLHFGAGNFSASVDANGLKHLHIPNLPMDSTFAGDLALGGIVHEDSHFSFTDFSEAAVSGILKKFLNVLEDIRCESLQIKRYPGARLILSKMVTAMVANGQFSPISENEGLSGALWYVAYRLRAEVLGQSAMDSLAASAAAVVKPQMPGASFQRLTAMMFEVMQCQTTGDCMELAEQIITMLKEEAENPTPPEAQDPNEKQEEGNNEQPQSPQDSSGAGDDGGQNDGAPGGGPDDGEGPSGSDMASDGTTGGNAGDGTETQGGAGRGSGNGAQDDQKAKAMKEFLAGSNGGTSMDTGDLIADALSSIDNDEPAVRLPDAIPLDRGSVQGEDILARLRAETNAVRRKIQALLEAKARTTLSNGRSGSRVDVKRLWRVRTGDARVFEKRIEGHKQDTALQILIDRSTSMRKADRITLACDSALAVALAMDGVQGVSTAVAAFPHVGADHKDDVLVVSDFYESFRKSAGRFPSVGVAGCTPMAEAMLWSGYQLHSTNKGRKILLVVTDGQPDRSDAAAEVIGRLEASGIEVLGLGINVHVGALFASSASIDDVGGLAVAMFGLLQERLAKAA